LAWHETATLLRSKAVLDQGGNTLDNAIKQNVVIKAEKLKNATPIIAKAVTEKKSPHCRRGV